MIPILLCLGLLQSFLLLTNPLSLTLDNLLQILNMLESLVYPKARVI